MHGWPTGVVLMLLVLSGSLKATANERQFPANSESKPQNKLSQGNSRVFGQANTNHHLQEQPRKFGAEPKDPNQARRTFGVDPQLVNARATFSNHSAKAPSALAKVFPSARLPVIQTTDSSHLATPQLASADLPNNELSNESLPPAEPVAEIVSLASIPTVPRNKESEISFTASFLSDPGRVGGLVGGITAGAVFLNPLAPIIGNVLGYFVGKSSDYSERKKELATQNTNARPIVTSEENVDSIRLNNN